MFALEAKELKILKGLSSPKKIQDFLDNLPTNFEKKGETIMSPRRVLRAKKGHCLEGALFAGAAQWINGELPLLMDFKSAPEDEDHVVALYKRNGYWGAISKTNRSILRFRDPIYRTIRELALSYFHEYFMFEDGKKTLVSYSKPLNLKQIGTKWITDEKNLWQISDALDAMTHFPLVPKKNKKFIRKAGPIEIKAAKLTEWKKSDPRT